MNLFNNFFVNPITNYPERQINSRLAQYEAYKLGWFIHWNMPAFDGDENYLSNGQHNANSPVNFTYAGSSIANWANSAETAGNVDFAYLTTKHQIGFDLYPNTIEYDGGNTFNFDDDYRTGLTLPYYQDYGVQSPLISVQQDIVGEYISTMKSKGIEPGLYYNIGKDINVRAGFDAPVNSCFDGSGNYRDFWAEWKLNGLASAKAAYPTLTGSRAMHYVNYENFVKAHITYLLNNFDINLLWFDAVAWYPRVALRELYELVKSIRPGCLVTYNLPPEDSPLTLYPNGTISNPPFTVTSDEIYLFQGGLPATDIICYEESRIAAASSEWASLTPHNGIDYYIPKEVCATSLTNRWFWNTGSSTARSDLQTLYDSVEAKGMRLNLSMSPKLDGTIDSTLLSAVSAITT